jgi:hypothetical protein
MNPARKSIGVEVSATLASVLDGVLSLVRELQNRIAAIEAGDKKRAEEEAAHKGLAAIYRR